MPMPPARLNPSWIARTNLSGTVAAVLSSVVVAACSACEARAPLAGVNAASQWFWGRRAKRHVGPSWRYTAVGYVVHHFSSLLWAGIYEAWCLRRPAPARVSAARAATVAMAACAVDYTITPPRFRPGFERHISRTSIAAVYVAFGVGLFAGAAARRRHVR
ncbi:hypothetical protein LQ772_06485 [Frateuria edaphi]|uniref:hypothetical protein n=1 Tax=Frateuria edaphi TaxID=2898793 RepID=UPI001E51E297|nr:hypothetical protein [Frateuria edaphi]UGB46938.1 hypothetical protein LQ772_06485 [Frateuria edaphi]